VADPAYFFGREQSTLGTRLRSNQRRARSRSSFIVPWQAHHKSAIIRSRFNYGSESFVL